MVAVTPAKNEQEIRNVFEEHGIELTDGAMAMRAVENNECVGSAAFTLIDGVLTLLSVKYPQKDMFICDLISRGVMNYGVNRGVLYCELGPAAPRKEFLMFGFIKSADEDSVNIIRTFTMCTHCKENKANG